MPDAAPTDDARPAALRRLLAYARPHRRTIALATTCSIVNKLLDLAPPFLIGMAVNLVVEREDSLIGRLGVPDPVDQLWVLAIATIVIWSGESLFEYLHRLLWRNLAQTVQHEIRLDAFASATELELAYFEDRSSGRLLTVLGEDVNQLERFLDIGANDLIQLSVTATAVSISFFLLAPEIAWMAMLPVPIVIWGSLRFQRRIGPRYLAVREEAGAVADRLTGSLGGMATVHGFTAEDHEVERLRVASDGYRRANARAIRLSSAFSPLIRMVIVIGFGVILIVGGKRALDGELDLGAFSAMGMLVQRLLWPFTSLGAMLDLYQRAMASTHRILDLRDRRPAIVSGPRRLERSAVRGHVAFRGVRFAYPGRAPTIDGLDLDVPAGHTVAVVGSTGAGKSTIVKLLLRFVDLPDDPAAGSVTLDGIDVRELDLVDLRRAIALVSQDVFLFDGTVRDNIAYGLVGAVEDEPTGLEATRLEATRREATGLEAIVEAARAAEADAFIRALPDGYDTLVGERGVRLSGGQRQRIAMSRAILKDAPVLVLDEATASVDNETEAAIQRSIARLGRDRTVLVIAHRLSTVRHAERIVVLDHGRVVEQGTHDELVGRAGIYAGLWAVQTGEPQARRK